MAEEQEMIAPDLEAALRAVLPADVAVACVPIDAAHPPLFPEEEAAIETARPARRQSFTAGRTAARRALALIGGPQVAVPRAGDRRPLWPDGFVGAIAHKGGWVAALAAHAADYAGLGVDLETPEPLPDGVAERICLPEELAEDSPLAGRDGAPLDRGKVIFTAKETLFKAYYPATLYYLHFSDARMTFGEGDGSFVAELTDDNAPAMEGARRFEGRFGDASGMLFAAMAVAKR